MNFYCEDTYVKHIARADFGHVILNQAHTGHNQHMPSFYQQMLGVCPHPWGYF